MSEKTERETFVINNEDGSVSLDPYAGKSREELKQRCGELCRALDDWQRIAMVLAEEGKDGLWPDARKELDDLIEAYKD